LVFLASFNLQTRQALNQKSNPKQAIQNGNQVMEEEDCDFSRLFRILLRLFTTQPANNPSPKSKKQPKPSPFKMQLHVFFFYHTAKKTTHNPLQTTNSQEKSSTILSSKFFIFITCPDCINTQKANISIETIQKK
jgi:hypothetical protein